jgi:hypothetical protein
MRTRWKTLLILVFLLTGVLSNSLAALGASSPQRLVAVRNSNNTLSYREFNGSSWSNWLGLPTTPSGLTARGDPAVASWGPGRVDFFFQGSDNALWHIARTNGTTWSAYEFLGGTLTSAPDAASLGTNHLFVALKNTNGTLSFKEWTGAWTNWLLVPTPPTTIKGAPSVVASSANVLDIFIWGGDNALWMITRTSGQWSSWQSLGGTLTASPDAASLGNGHRFVAVRDTLNSLSYKEFPINGTWGPWVTLGGGLTSDPAAVSPEPGRIDVYVRATDNTLNTRSRDPVTGQWSGWQSLGGVLNSGPDASRR